MRLQLQLLEEVGGLAQWPACEAAATQVPTVISEGGGNARKDESCCSAKCPVLDLSSVY